MRSAYALTAAVLTVPYIAMAAPMTKRDGVTCNKTYAGSLVLMNLEQNYVGDQPKMANAYLDGDTPATIAASLDSNSVAMRVQFDTCTTDGWNVDGQQYGQVKPEGQDYSCFTVSDSASASATISIQPCGSENSGILESQWFKGEWDDQGGFHVISTGNPNDNPNVRPNTVYVYSGDAPNPNVVSVQAQHHPALTEFQFMGIEYF